MTRTYEREAQAIERLTGKKVVWMHYEGNLRNERTHKKEMVFQTNVGYFGCWYDYTTKYTSAWKVNMKDFGYED